VMVPGQKFLPQVGSFFCAQVGSVISEYGKFPQKSQLFNFFTFGSKKISLDLLKKYSGQRQVDPLFTVAQKYAQVGSGPIPRLVKHFRF